VISEDILQRFPDLFGAKKVNNHDVDVEQTIATFTRELRADIAAALTARRRLLESPLSVHKNMPGRSGGRRLKIA
jgi:malate synthase